MSKELPMPTPRYLASPPISRGRLAAIALLTAALAACSAENAGPADEKPSFSGGGCNVTATKFQTDPRTPPHNTNNNEAIWFLHNNSGSNIAVVSIGCTHSGGVTACTPENSETTLLPGQTDFEVSYNVGTAIGTVGLTVTLACGPVTIPSYKVRPS
jgi:hypothetical protein